MKLQILIPQYKETQDIIKPMLDSIMTQQGIDFKDIGVIITNDGSDTIIPDSFFEQYPYQIDYYLYNHTGVSGTRNFCLDRATADYVMFCDADDMFLSNGGLYIVFQEIEKGEFDCFISIFSEEQKLNGKSVFVNHEDDATFVHGKIYRRQYLIDKKIRFNQRLTIHEDSYFNYLCRVCTTPDRIRICNSPFYLWKYRENSICRNDSKYILKTYNHMVLSTSCLIDELLRRGLMENAAVIACNFIYDTYFTMNKEEWNLKENQEFIENFYGYFIDFYKKYMPVGNLLKDKQKKEIITNSRNRSIRNGNEPLDKFTFDEWIQIVKSYEVQPQE